MKILLLLSIYFYSTEQVIASPIDRSGLNDNVECEEISRNLTTRNDVSFCQSSRADRRGGMMRCTVQSRLQCVSSNGSRYEVDQFWPYNNICVPLGAQQSDVEERCEWWN